MTLKYNVAMPQFVLDPFTAEGSTALPEFAGLDAETLALVGALSMQDELRRKTALENAMAQQPYVETWGPHQILPPSGVERDAMREAAITFEDGSYRLGQLRYHRLADALACARLRRTHRSSGLQY